MKFSIIMKRELKSYFSGPVAYIVTALFLLVAGVMFFTSFFLGDRVELRNFFSWLPIYLSVFVPALTMRVFAEEKRSGSIETLMTLPVTEFDVVLGKYLASFISTLIMIAPTLFYVITAYIFGSPDFGPVVLGYLGTFLLSAGYTAIGIFSSSITKNQIIAFFTGMIICIALTLLNTFLVFIPGPAVSVLSYLSAKNHFDSVVKGIIDTRDIIYFVSLAVLFFALTVRVQKKESR